MNATIKIFLALLVGVAAGVLIARSFAKEATPADPFDAIMQQLEKEPFHSVRPAGKYTAEQDTFHRKMMRLIDKAGGRPVPMEYMDRPTQPITRDEALEMIERYRNSPLELYTHVGEKLENLRGWFLERDSVLEVFARNPESNGLQFYLARKNMKGYDPLTIIWVPRNRDDNIDYEAQWTPGNDAGSVFRSTADTVWWRDAHDYLRPCPPDCPPR
jgi:hypothetical protein